MGAVCSCASPRLAEKRKSDEPNSYLPSSMSYSASTPTIKDFKEPIVESQYTGPWKILVICTTKYLLPMVNGKLFNTGHQASETFVPIYYMDKCGFQFDIATPDGGEVALEEWTFKMATGYEPKLREMQTKLKDKLEQPLKLSDVPTDLAPYAAIFLPGGHGPLIEQHKIERLGELLRSAHERSLPTISICHGPTAFRAAALAGNDFPYQGYKMCVFPDKVDMKTPKFGYLPGYLREEDKCEAKLKELGVLIQNAEMDDSVCVDREVITGASQAASQTLAIAAINELAKKYDFKVSA